MATKRLKQPQRSLKEAFLIICEGDTERNYVDFLRNCYHSPIRVVSKIAGQQVSQKLIKKHVDHLKMDKYDTVTTFLMYDMDVEEVNQRFTQCEATLLVSNPCVEFWFLLHNTECANPLSSEATIRELKKSNTIWKQYEKGVLTFPQQSFLWQNRDKAILRAKTLQLFAHPSSSIYFLLDRLENTIQKQ